MSTGSLLKNIYLSYFSRPAADRSVYRAIRRQRIRNIVELGLGDGRRTQRMILLAQEVSPGQDIRYAGIDLFEARPANEPRWALKVAYKELKRLTPHVQLAPGDAFQALSRTANSLLNTDLVVIGADQDPEAVSRAWAFLPRMLHDKSLVLREERLGSSRRTRFVSLSRDEILRLASEAPRQQRAAA